MLIAQITSLASEKPNDMTVIRYLCLALSALALQLSQNGIVQQILAWLNPIISSSPLVLLELLTVLPEECSNRHILIDYTARDLFAEQLSASASEVFRFLEALEESGDVKIKKQVLRCFEKWIGTLYSSSSQLRKLLFLSYD